ncbi:carbon-nitrogen hydrolase family protein [Caloranaerobacter azorensis]|uniref:Carbon-nitrogen hydrolase family protein n=1 Tax=Caloranaerobacter azorensis TaxID=116090 RepID=A0A6P1YDE5_9FIRM|nr:carbon-nitrogen hydrolase family protein [Caloranaerobacter azorensis]QIB26808.1 carbon-nitrogen hydrolase family protein [Caloranaerobacter azorensis]
MKKFKLGLCQLLVSENKKENIKNAEKMINSAADMGSELVVLPEMFNCPYNNSYFPKYAESYPDGETIKMLSKISKERGIYLIGGSIPEKDDKGNIYNTSFVFDKKGNIIGKHRKIHLFDIDVEGKISFKESDVLSRGDSLTIVDTEYCKIGVAICYDIRFPELFRLMVLKGVKVIIVPAAFNMTTGPAHWELLFRARALDNQVYMAAAAPARDENASYISYGNSIITDPWGSIVGKLDEKEGILIKEIDLNRIDEIREQLPILKHLRKDLYQISLQK